jgi:hypothetical protein
MLMPSQCQMPVQICIRWARPAQFFEFAIVVVVLGSLIALATAVWSFKRAR